jgi:hypothetical protein
VYPTPEVKSVQEYLNFDFTENNKGNTATCYLQLSDYYLRQNKAVYSYQIGAER